MNFHRWDDLRKKGMVCTAQRRGLYRSDHASQIIDGTDLLTVRTDGVIID